MIDIKGQNLEEERNTGSHTDEVQKMTSNDDSESKNV